MGVSPFLLKLPMISTQEVPLPYLLVTHLPTRPSCLLIPSVACSFLPARKIGQREDSTRAPRWGPRRMAGAVVPWLRCSAQCHSWAIPYRAGRRLSAAISKTISEHGRDPRGKTQGGDGLGLAGRDQGEDAMSFLLGTLLGTIALSAGSSKKKIIPTFFSLLGTIGRTAGNRKPARLRGIVLGKERRAYRLSTVSP